jgi:large subunit ribosomal protein L17
MRHKKKKFSLNRFTSWRKATLRSMARNILLHGRIKTTLTKAKAGRIMAEKLISLGKADDLASRRRAFSVLGDHKLVALLFKDIAPLFKNRIGGYTRIIRLGLRRGDDAKLVLLELTEIKKVAKKPKKIKENKLQESKAHDETKPSDSDKTVEEKKPKTEVLAPEKPPISQKPTKKFLGGIRNIFKKKRDSL